MTPSDVAWQIKGLRERGGWGEKTKAKSNACMKSVDTHARGKMRKIREEKLEENKNRLMGKKICGLMGKKILAEGESDVLAVKSFYWIIKSFFILCFFFN